MTWKVGLGIVLAGVFASACGSEASEGGAPKESTTKSDPEPCTSEGSCRGCGSCVDLCRCGGGTQASCKAECEPNEIPPPPPPPIEVGADGRTKVTLVTQEFDVGPGEETFRCQNFANPFGRDVVVLESRSTMAQGSHHMFVFQGNGFEAGSLETCGGLEFGPNVHSSQRSEESFEYPPGVGRSLPSSDNLRIQAHYLNTTETTIHAYVAVTLEVVDPSEVDQLASYVFINTLGVSVPPHSNGSANAGCTAPEGAQLLTASSHMHQHGVHFVARTRDDQLVYETNDWAEPEPWRFEPTLRIEPGGGIDIHCEYENDTSSFLSFGESAETNEMCILSGVYYPAPAGAPIVCLF